MANLYLHVSELPSFSVMGDCMEVQLSNSESQPTCTYVHVCMWFIFSLIVSLIDVHVWCKV